MRAHLAALAALLITATTAQAVITVLTPLSQIVQSDTYIFVAKADKLDPDNKDRPTATFTVTKKLKGEPPFDRLPVNMTGDDEGKKAGDTKTIFDRIDTSRELVFFVLKQGKAYNAKVFVEGSWFSVYGTLDADGKTVRWAFLHGEPFLRRTFKGTSAELVKTVEDALAKKGKPPEPDEKEKPGYGPPVAKEKKCGDGDEPRGATAGPLFAVIPSFVLVGPLALIAALFPGVFARLAVGMKRWRAFLVVASLNSTLALVYFAFTSYLPKWVPSGRAFAPQSVTLYFTLIAVAGLVWAGRRYRRMAATEPDVTAPPSRAELYTLAGLTAFAAVCTLLTAWFADWNSTVSLPMREFTFIGTALAVATCYAGYRMLTRASDLAPGGAEPPVRLSASGEAVGLATLALCGFAPLLLAGGQRHRDWGRRRGVRPAPGGRADRDRSVRTRRRQEGAGARAGAVEPDARRRAPLLRGRPRGQPRLAPGRQPHERARRVVVRPARAAAGVLHPDRRQRARVLRRRAART
jgi:hypothetical protein